MQNEVKQVVTRTVEGREVIVSAVWKWGPGFTEPTPKNKTPIGVQVKTRH